MKIRLPSAGVMRKIAAFLGILVGVYIGFGTFYVWYNGTNNSELLIEDIGLEVKQKSEPNIIPTRQDIDAPVGVSVQMSPSVLMAGSSAYLSVRTSSNAECGIEVEYGLDKKSSATGLVLKLADNYGSVGWNWVIDNDAPKGVWPAKVTCSKNGKSGVVIEKLKIN